MKMATDMVAGQIYPTIIDSFISQYFNKATGGFELLVAPGNYNIVSPKIANNLASNLLNDPVNVNIKEKSADTDMKGLAIKSKMDLTV